MMISIDPDLRNPAYALFQDGKLIRADFWQGSTVLRGPKAWVAVVGQVKDTLLDYEPDTCVVELPMYYAGKSVGEDILELSSALGAILGVVVTVNPGIRLVEYRPRAWKGTMKKEIHQRVVILPSLDKQEAALIGKRHREDVIDAVGLGLFHLGRLRRRVDE